MEKFLSSAMFLLLVTGLLTGCQGSPAEESVEQVTGQEESAQEEAATEPEAEVKPSDDAQSHEVKEKESHSDDSKEEAKGSTTVDFSAQPDTSTPATPTEPATSTPVSAYKDGTYSSTKTYASPAGQDDITVKVTIKNDVVTSVSSSATSGNEVSLRYQQNFNGAIQGLVVGKSLKDLGSFSAISGASLTTPAFNAALEAIRGQARA